MKLIVAVPVIQQSVAAELAHEVDELVTVLEPSDLFAIGAWYDDFSQLSDDDVRRILAETSEEAEASKQAH